MFCTRIQIYTAFAKLSSLPLSAWFGVVGMLFLLTNTQATQIYKSIDADGNITYSSIPPKDALKIKKMDVPTNFDVGTGTEDSNIIDEIKAAGEQLEEDRKKREQEREAAQKKIAEEEAKKQAEKPAEPVIHYYPVFPPHHHHPGAPHPPRPHPPRPRPPHPKPKPPLPEPPQKPLPR